MNVPMKRAFTSSVIPDNAASLRQKRVVESLLIMLALLLLCLGTAGFITLFKNITAQQDSQSSLVTPHKSLLTFIFPSLQFSCSPIRGHDLIAKNGMTTMWQGVCRSVDKSNTRKIELRISSSMERRNRFKGFKLAKEVLYIFTDVDHLLESKRASSFSTFFLAGGTVLKIKSQREKKFKNTYIVGLGLGLGFFIDKNIQLEWKEVDSTLTAKK
jgi:hypothetical protein